MWMSIITYENENVCMTCVANSQKTFTRMWNFCILIFSKFIVSHLVSFDKRTFIKKHRETCDAKCMWFFVGWRLKLNIHPQPFKLFLVLSVLKFPFTIQWENKCEESKKNLIVSTCLAPFQLRQDMQTLWRSWLSSMFWYHRKW